MNQIETCDRWEEFDVYAYRLQELALVEEKRSCNTRSLS